MTSATDSLGFDSLSPEQFERFRRNLEAQANFKAEWLSGSRPRIERELEKAPREEWSELLRELLALELSLRANVGETPTPEDYWDRFPDHSEDVAWVFQVPNRGQAEKGSGESTQTIARDIHGTVVPPMSGFSPGEAKAAAPSNHGTRYRSLSELNKGGLGVVSLAYDEELHRQVALKEIQPRYAYCTEHRSRFLMEAESTAKLDHPGIVPVYGQGVYSDGRLFYAMRLIPGVTFREAIKSFHQGDLALPENSPMRILALRQLLSRFVSICQTMAYAHSRDVIHRDLKPDNVMIGQFGEVLVVDWGLAKILNPASSAAHHESSKLRLVIDAIAESQTNQVIGTPHYMSPEQAEGNPRLLSPRSDIYSLGAILYCLLSGKDPFSEQDQVLLLKKVQTGDFPPPRSVNRAVDPSLEAICLKAMAVKSEDRYDSARDCADDIERWLADEPVSARREPLSSRWARWMRRHRVLVTTAFVLLITASVALAIGIAIISRKQTQLIVASNEAERNLQIMRAEVGGILRFFGDDFPLSTLPQSEEIRESNAMAATTVNSMFLNKKPGDRFARHDLALAQRTLGNVRQKLGLHEFALLSYGNAIVFGERLIQDFPQNPFYLRELINAHLDRAEALRIEGYSSEAQIAYEKSEALAERNLMMLSFSISARLDLSRAQFGLAVTLRDSSQLDRAQELFTKVLEFRNAMPKIVTAENDLESALVFCAYAQTLRERDDKTNALHFLRRALEHLDQFLPLNDDARYIQACCQLEMGRAFPRGSTESMQAMTDAVTNFEILSKNFPISRDYQLMTALSRLALTETLRFQNDEARALKEAATAYQTLKTLEQRFLKSPAYKGYLGQALAAQGQLFSVSRPLEALKLLEQAQAYLDIALKSNPGAVAENRSMRICVRLLQVLKAKSNP